jgi:nucleotide-binding universal stress UspA family protein
MTIGTILVHLNHEERARELIAAAAVLARKGHAHVVGLYVMPPLFIAADMVFPMPGDVVSLQIEQQKAQAARIEAVFREATKGEPFVAEWRVRDDSALGGGTIASGVIAEAYAADLVVASQALPDARTLGLSDVAERVALESGRPVLVVPNAWLPREIGANVLIAWNDSREAARAAFDGMSVLQAGAKARVVSVKRRKVAERGRNVPGADIAATLARHGFTVEAETVEDDASVGHALLARAGKDGTDLLVMGAYGHSRFRELVLGGTTREILKSMSVPVLMSH